MNQSVSVLGRRLRDVAARHHLSALMAVSAGLSIGVVLGFRVIAPFIFS